LMRRENNARTNAGRNGASNTVPALTTNLVGGRMAEIESKTCIKCGQCLPLTEFHRTPNNCDGRVGSCKACRNAYQKAWVAALPPNKAEARRLRHVAVCRKYDAANRDKIAEYGMKNRERETARYTAWRRANPERWRDILKASSYRRRSRIAEGMGGPATRAWFDAQKKVCHWCGERCANNASIDHIAPLSRGGLHVARNLCIACIDCNRRKSARDPIEWAQMIGKLL
jgi:5-methylcytosine-specific restriction endonuclease McrA